MIEIRSDQQSLEDEILSQKIHVKPDLENLTPPPKSKNIILDW